MTGEDRTTPRLVIRRQEFDRLRAIEEAARAVSDLLDDAQIAWGTEPSLDAAHESLRAALEGAPHE